MIENYENNWKFLEVPGVTGRPEQMLGKALVEFTDDVTISLGPDLGGELFERIAGMMMSGDYYPPEIIFFDGKFRNENRELQVGDRILQLARLPLLFGYRTRTIAEIFVAKRTEYACQIGYYTTEQHFAKGWWQATLARTDQELTLNIKCHAGPGSLVYWLAIPVARFLQERARKTAMSRFLSWV